MSWVLSPWGALVAYAVAALVVTPVLCWAFFARQRAEREAEHLQRWYDARTCEHIAEATRRHEAARRAHPSSQPPDE